MYSTILIPLDGSKRAEAILPHVTQLARLYKADIVLLQVFELPHLIDLPKVEDDDFAALPHQNVTKVAESEKQAHAYLQSIVNKLTDKGISARQRVEFGPIAATIMRTANLEGADLIAMASHGSSGVEGVYYGSVAAGVLQRVDRPLLIVRAEN